MCEFSPSKISLFLFLTLVPEQIHLLPSNPSKKNFLTQAEQTMNKLVPILLFSLLVSFLALWYQTKKTTKAPLSQENVLIVGTNSEYAPFSYMENNQIVGFDIDLINEIAKVTGKTLVLQDMPFDALIPALQTGQLQIIASGITPTEKRALQVNFTKPYLKGDQLLIVSQAEAPLKTVEELTDKKVAVNEGFTADYYMSAIKGPQLVRFASPIESFMALASGRIDALVAAENSVKPFLDHYGANKFSVAQIPDTTDEYALAISKKYPELVDQIQQAIDQLEANGTLDALKQKWKLN